MKIWDIGGQFQYRQNWIDYAKMADVIIFMVDSSKVSLFNSSMTVYLLVKRSYTIYLMIKGSRIDHYLYSLIK